MSDFSKTSFCENILQDYLPDYISQRSANIYFSEYQNHIPVISGDVISIQILKPARMIKYIDRLIRMDALIHLRATGTPDEFAYKLGIKRSTLFLTLQTIRDKMDVDIKYSCAGQSYYYADGKRIKISVKSESEL
jgi:hypothetical protein